MLKFFEKSTRQDITEFLKELKYDAQHVKDINALKNESLYVGFNGNKFVAPKSVITKEMVDDIAFKADIRIHAIIPMFPTEEQLDEIVEFFKQNENELSISISNNSKLLSCAIFGSTHTIGFESNLSEF